MKFKKIIFPIFIILLLCGILFYIFFGRRVGSLYDNENSSGFDAIVYTQSWPKAVCTKWKKESPSNLCSLPAHDNWTIHGIWPSFFKKDGPNYCPTTVKFDINKISSIENQLKIKWTDVHGNIDDDNYFSFWKHEWDKHGTCGMSHKKLNSVFKYFQTGLDLAHEYDITKILTNAKIKPGKSYEIESILDKINNILGKRSHVTCFMDKIKNKSYLLEISICLDESLKNLIDCDDVGIDSRPTNCMSKTSVIYI